MANGLRRLDGVAEVTVDLQRNLCVLTPDPDRALALPAVREAVRQAGFRPGRVFLEARGATEPASGKGTMFRIAGWPEALRVDGEVVDLAPFTALFVETPDLHLVPAPWPNDL